MSEAQEMETLVKDLKQAADDVKKVAETTQTEVKNLGKVTDETKQKADEALVKHNEISERLSVIEQKMTQPDGRDDERQKSAGQMVAESEELKSFIAGGGKGRISIAVKRDGRARQGGAGQRRGYAH
ncbi:hypothetical protein [Brevundimonas naejangsanensis]|uniref:hypothetical protein n=1 Tax=Brevundimonas naejangsanensis TaxID=588932 RepID=UPI0026ECC26D|nr:hypothetical protein [Brevundimonas naejangsanensis]